MVGNLVRLRANPNTVRVGIRYVSGSWLASVTSGSIRALAYADNPEQAVERALEYAARIGLAGVDLGMQWSYEHPQRVNKPDAYNVEPKEGDKS